ncbi:sodium:calcium antiporter [Bacteroidota bacterium]
MGIFIPLFLVVVCCLLIWRASDGFAIASDYIGRNLSDGVRGATINAIGSSLPELFTSLFFLFYLKDVDGFSGGIGTTAGSAIFNGMIIPAAVILVVVFTAVATNIKVSRKVVRRDGLSLITAEFIFIILISGNKLDWWHGFILMIIYFIYLTYMLKSMQKTGMLEKEKKKSELRNIEYSEISLFKAILVFDLRRVVLGRSKINSVNAWPLLIISTIAIATVCLLLVQACEWIGSDVYTIPFVEGTFHGMDIPIMFVAVILASAASSVPDTIISMNDARKGNYDDAISNALGSNIFDICFAMGFPLFLYTLVYGPIHMHQEVIDMSSELRMLLLLLTISAFLVYIFRKKIGLTQAFMLLGLYTIFSIYVVGRGLNVSIAGHIAEGLRIMVDFINFLN